VRNDVGVVYSRNFHKFCKQSGGEADYFRQTEQMCEINHGHSFVVSCAPIKFHLEITMCDIHKKNK
jgi:hypothetical protein